MSSQITGATRDEVRERTDIVELVQEYIPTLKRAGKDYQARCPFHDDKRPSLAVVPDKQMFYCFACQAGGDVFTFVMRFEDLSFREALEKLAERAGLRVAPPDSKLSARDLERKKIREALSHAADYYHVLLAKLKAAEPAREYLLKRGLDQKTIDAFRVGFAPSTGVLLKAATKKGYASETLLKAGLIAERRGRTRDFFWDRVVFPIDNARGEVVGFGARTMGDGMPKYLNTPETPVFSKSRILYGFHAALQAMRKERSCILLEGYMDVLAAHQYGFVNVCAPLGTALTEENADRLKKYVDQVIVVFDADTAGANAALKGAKLLLAKGVTVKVATLPEGMDPDDLLHSRGAATFQKSLAAAVDLPDFKTQVLLRGKLQPYSAELKARVAGAVLETIAQSSNEVLKSEWVRSLAEELKLDERSLYAQMHKAPGTPQPRRQWHSAPPPGRVSPLPVVERDILLYLFSTPSLAVDDDLVAESDFGDARARGIFLGLRKVLGEGRGHDNWSNRLLDILDAEQAALTRAIFVDNRKVREPAQVVARIVGEARKRRRYDEIKPLVLRMVDGKIPVDEEIQKEYTRLKSELFGTRKGE